VCYFRIFYKTLDRNAVTDGPRIITQSTLVVQKLLRFHPIHSNWGFCFFGIIEFAVPSCGLPSSLSTKTRFAMGHSVCKQTLVIQPSGILALRIQAVLDYCLLLVFGVYPSATA
jgi:hypothetical protein